jgi:cell division ATPase FtsA
MPVRIVAPTGVGGLTDSILTPAYSTAIGLLQWGSTILDEGDSGRFESAPAGGMFGRLRDAVRGMFP